MKPAPAARLGWLAVVIAFGCEGGDARFTAKLASDFAPAGQAISVLGLYKDGRLLPDGWQTVAPYVSAALGSSSCPVGYEILAASNPPLADAIDEYARTDGPSDDLVAQLAPAARGDVVLIVAIAGRLPQKASAADAGARRPASTMPAPGANVGRGGGRGMRGGGRTGGPARNEPPKDANVLEISASLYSVSARRSVALLELEYSGPSVDDAMRRFGQALAQTIPGARCTEWNWEVKLDPDRIRQSIDE
jgi:hypothetical protein